MAEWLFRSNCIPCLQGIQYPIPAQHKEAVICFFVGSVMRYTTDQSLSVYEHFNALRNVASCMLQPHVAPSVEPGRCELTSHSGREYGPRDGSRDLKVNLQVWKIENTWNLEPIFEATCTRCLQLYEHCYQALPKWQHGPPSNIHYFSKSCDEASKLSSCFLTCSRDQQSW